MHKEDVNSSCEVTTRNLLAGKTDTGWTRTTCTCRLMLKMTKRCLPIISMSLKFKQVCFWSKQHYPNTYDVRQQHYSQSKILYIQFHRTASRRPLIPFICPFPTSSSLFSSLLSIYPLHLFCYSGKRFKIQSCWVILEVIDSKLFKIWHWNPSGCHL